MQIVFFMWIPQPGRSLFSSVLSFSLIVPTKFYKCLKISRTERPWIIIDYAVSIYKRTKKSIIIL